MTLQEAMTALESMSTLQNRKVYARHGAGDNLFGVSFANLDKLKKKIKTDHALAQELWNTGNADARALAAMIADPPAMSEADLDRWAGEIRYYVLADIFARHLASRSPHARKKMASWTRSKEEFVGQAGWALVALLAMNDAGIPDSVLEKHLRVIERQIHGARNRVRHAMNGALIAIGLRNAGLRKNALAAAARIGKVQVDHGETGCKTPDAAAYIKKSLARKRRTS